MDGELETYRGFPGEENMKDTILGRMPVVEITADFRARLGFTRRI